MVRRSQSGNALIPAGFGVGMPEVNDDVWIDFADTAYMKWVLALPDLAGNAERTEAMRRARLDCILPYMYAGWTRLSWRALTCSIQTTRLANRSPRTCTSSTKRIGDTMVGRTVDPLLVEAGTVALTDPMSLRRLTSHRLRRDSPCIGTGILMTDHGGRDFWGNRVPESGRPAVGAFQPGPGRLGLDGLRQNRPER
jgi:hypothetical protein